MTKSISIDQYCEQFSGPAAALLQDLARMCRNAAPAATEAIKWGHPAFVHPQGTILFVFSGHSPLNKACK